MFQSSRKKEATFKGSWVVIIAALAAAAVFVWWVQQAAPTFTPVEETVSLK